MNKNYDPALAAFESSLAQYQGRVYEAYFLTATNEMDAIESQRLNPAGVSKQTVLSIEDNADEWFIIRWALLQQFPEAELVWLSDSTQVIPYLETCLQTEKDLPRLILLDLYLPTSTAGLNVLQALKAHALYHRIPTVILSQSNCHEDITESFNHSANSYIVKPTKYQEWTEELGRLRTYLKKSTVN